MERLRRMQIYLEPELSAALERLARKRGISKTALIRLAARQLLAGEISGAQDPIFGIIGLGDAGPERTSEEHDHVLATLFAPPH